MSSDGYRDGIPNKTEFIGNGFGIDPEDCGCTDCLIGQAFHPSEDWRMKAAIAQGRPLYNRTGHEVILPNGVRLADDDVWRPNTTTFFHGSAAANAVMCPNCGYGFHV